MTGRVPGQPGSAGTDAPRLATARRTSSPRGRALRSAALWTHAARVAHDGRYTRVTSTYASLLFTEPLALLIVSRPSLTATV